MLKSDENPEERLLQLAAHGDKQAFGTLYTRYLDEIYRFVFLKVGSKLTAEDITEESFIKAWEYLPRIYKKNENVKNFRAWLYRIANNTVIDFYRKKKPAENLDITEPSQSALPETLAIKSQEIRQIERALRELKSDYQQIIILRLVNDLSHKEAASIMKINENHARVLLHRALNKLKELMSKAGGNHAEDI